MPAGKSYSVKAIIQGVDRMTAPVRRIAAAVRTRLGGALAHIGGLARRATGILSGMLGPLGLLAGGGIVASLGAMVHGFASAGDEIGKFARQVGIGVEALQELQFAADRQGVPAKDFRTALVMLNKGIGEARMGTGKLKTVLDKLPPAFRDAMLGAEDTGAAMDIALGALGAVADASDRAALATALFGRSGVKMARLAEAGAEGIAKLRQEARDLGLVVGKDATDAAEEFVDRMTDLKATLSGLKMMIGSALIPAIRPIIVQLTEWIRKNRELISQKVAGFMRRIVEWISRIDFSAIGSAIEGVVGFVGKLYDGVGGLNGVLLAMGAITFGPLLASLGPVGAALGAILALAVGVQNAIANISGRGEQKATVGAAYAGAAAKTGDQGALRQGAAAAASGQRDRRVASRVLDVVGDRSVGSRVASAVLLPFSLTAASATDAPSSGQDIVRGSVETAREFARALAAELNAGPPTAGTLRALDIRVLDERVEVKERPAPGRRTPFLPRSFR